MTNDYRAQARACLGNGYLIVPIKPGEKRPAMAGWQKARLGVDDLGVFERHGVGVLTGQGAHPLAAADVDTTCEPLAEEFASWLRGKCGVPCERVGAAPKALLLFRAAQAGWGKATSAWFEDDKGGRHRLEWLGQGQQFVAYAIHPGTGKPYAWTDWLGGIEEVPAGELPEVTLDLVQASIEAFERLAIAHGLRRVDGAPGRPSGATGGRAQEDDDPLMTYSPPVGLDAGEARRLMEHVDNADYETWIRVGACLHHEFEGGQEGLDLWDEWSSSADNYQGIEDLQRRWEGFGASGRAPITARWLIKVGRAAIRDAVREQQHAALAQARRAIEACSDSIVLLGDVAREAGRAAGEDAAMRAELRGLLQARFRVLTGTSLTAAEARASMLGGRVSEVARVAAEGSGARRRDSELGLADRMVDRYGAGLMYVPELVKWFKWTGNHWVQAHAIEIEHLAKETIRALPNEAKQIASDEERARFWDFCRRAQGWRSVSNIIALAASDPRVAVPARELDKNLDLLGAGNCTIDLRTGKAHAPRREDRITVSTDVDYYPGAKCPLFEATLLDVFKGDRAKVLFFQKLIGYALLGRPDEDILAILHGGGSNGKSTIMSTIRGALGDHAATANANTFLSHGPGSDTAGSARPDILRLMGKRIVTVTEPEEGAALRESVIKSMTGGDALPARTLYSSAIVEVIPTWTVFMSTNHKPIVAGSDTGIWRRLMLVPFLRDYDKDSDVVKDPQRPAKLRSEWSGVLAWCVQGAVLYLLEGLALTDEIVEAKQDYRDEMDLLKEWQETCCVTGPWLRATTAELWASWEQFAKSRGELRFIPSSRSLGRRLSAKFAIFRTKAERGFVGICVKRVGDFT